MDHEWELDVKKADAYPPERLNSEFIRIAKNTRDKALGIYRARLGSTKVRKFRTEKQQVWIRSRRGDKVFYRLNNDHPVLAKLLSESGLEGKSLKSLFHIIETTVPHKEIIMDERQQEDCHVALPSNLFKPPKELLDFCKVRYLQELDENRTKEEAIDIVCSVQPFDSHVAYRLSLEEL